MRAKSVKIAATVVVLAVALGGLMYATLSDEAEYYKHVDEVMVDPAVWHGKRLQLHGFVVDKSIERRPDTLQYRFRVESKGKAVQAYYTGVVPDTFKHGTEVVLKGTLGPDGFNVAPGGVVAKCPSKYEPAKGVAPASTGS
jgi:cytochrome c-type biogenesis protein CcmE